MQRLTLGMGLCALGMSSIFALGKARDPKLPPERPAVAFEDPLLASVLLRDPAGDSKQAPASSPTPSAALGLSCSSVSPELRAHLGLLPGEGVLVERVEPGSKAAESNWKEFDVVVGVEGQAATPESFEAALQSGIGVALEVFSGGVLRDLIVEGDPASEHEFLSVESLGPNHPLRRVGRLEALRSRYAETTTKYRERQRELDEEARRERERAKQGIEELLTASDERVRAYFDARQAELLSWLEAELADSRVEPLQGLNLNLGELLGPDRLQKLEDDLAAQLQSLEEIFEAGLQLEIDEEYPETGKRARQSLRKTLEHQIGQVEQRMGRPLAELHEQLDQHRERLLEGHVERVAWTQQTVGEIRAQVQERIECAFDRSAELFHKRMRSRLHDMDLPRAGEVQASLEDLTAQVEAWSQRFITRTQAGLQLFARALNERPDGLGAELLLEVERCEKSLAQWTSHSQAALKAQLATSLVIDGNWQSSHGLKLFADALEFPLQEAQLAQRRVLGPRVGSAISTLREERELSEMAWQDLRKKLGRLLQEAGNDCWELDGPHLDGRFPRKSGEVSVVR